MKGIAREQITTPNQMILITKFAITNLIFMDVELSKLEDAYDGHQ